MAADPVFVDTNVLIYATRRTASEHAAAQAALEGEGRALWISNSRLATAVEPITLARLLAKRAAANPGSARDAHACHFREDLAVLG